MDIFLIVNYVRYSPDCSKCQQSKVCSLFSGLLEMPTVKSMFVIITNILLTFVISSSLEFNEHIFDCWHFE
jgi:hypothetical protein